MQCTDIGPAMFGTNENVSGIWTNSLLANDEIELSLSGVSIALTLTQSNRYTVAIPIQNHLPHARLV